MSVSRWRLTERYRLRRPSSRRAWLALSVASIRTANRADPSTACHAPAGHGSEPRSDAVSGRRRLWEASADWVEFARKKKKKIVARDLERNIAREYAPQPSAPSSCRAAIHAPCTGAAGRQIAGSPAVRRPLLFGISCRAPASRHCVPAMTLYVGDPGACGCDDVADCRQRRRCASSSGHLSALRTDPGHPDLLRV